MPKDPGVRSPPPTLGSEKPHTPPEYPFYWHMGLKSSQAQEALSLPWSLLLNEAPAHGPATSNFCLQALFKGSLIGLREFPLLSQGMSFHYNGHLLECSPSLALGCALAL